MKAALVTFLALTTATAQAQTCGFDRITGASLAGHIFYTSLVVTAPAVGQGFVAGTTWTPDVNQTGRSLWAVVGIDSPTVLDQIVDWNVAIWESPAALEASPLVGTYYHRSSATPDLGSLEESIVTLGGSDPGYLVGMDLEGLAFNAGEEYLMSIFVRRTGSAFGLAGIVESDLPGPLDFQFGLSETTSPGFSFTAGTAASQHSGVQSYALEADTVVELGPGCGGVGATPGLALTSGCAAVGGVLDATASDLTPNSAGALYVSLGAATPFPLGGGCSVYLDLAGALILLPVLADPIGGWSGSVPLPDTTGLAGQAFTLQGATFGTAGPLGIDLTAGLRFTLTL